jgi:hypothetical protein
LKKKGLMAVFGQINMQAGARLAGWHFWAILTKVTLF